MKKLLFSIFFLTSLISFSQNNFRITDKQKAKLLKAGETSILTIENGLNENFESLNNGTAIKLFNPTELLSKAHQSKNKVYKEICLQCYDDEYKKQLSVLETQNKEKQESFDKESLRRDSLFKAEIKERDKRINEKSKLANEPYNPYNKFIYSMDMLGRERGIKHGCFTIFTNMDEELVRTRFSFYLQDRGYTYGKESLQKNEHNFIEEYYIRKTAIDNEANDYIKVKYYYTENNKYPSYFGAITESQIPCWLVDKVIIEGTANTIINLYLNYWAKDNKTIGGANIGEASSLIFMGDKITLSHTGNKYRIEINKQGGGLNYYSSYNINQR